MAVSARARAAGLAGCEEPSPRGVNIELLIYSWGNKNTLLSTPTKKGCLRVKYPGKRAINYPARVKLTNSGAQEVVESATLHWKDIEAGIGYCIDSQKTHGSRIPPAMMCFGGESR